MSGTEATLSAGGRGLAPAVTIQAFEGFLKRAGHLLHVALAEIVKYAMPIASLIGVLTPNSSATEVAFLASVQMIGGTVIAVEQKWATSGSEAGAQKLADVLAIVEQPVVTLFAQAGIAVDAPYVINLINGIVALLNAQPGDALGPLQAKTA